MTDDRIIDIFEQHGQYVTPRDYALIRSIAEAVAPQRKWVGLTDEQVIKTFNAICNGKPFNVERILELHRANEAKLKEKNT